MEGAIGAASAHGDTTVKDPPRPLSRMLARNRLKRILGTIVRPMARCRRTPAAPVLCYHSVNPLPRLHSVTPEMFEVQLQHLMKHFRVLLLDELIAEFQCGGPSVRSAAVTFDDGYVDNYLYAFPILQRHRCPATIFLPTGFVEGELRLIDEPEFDPLNWEQIREMRAQGIRFGAHGHTHRILTPLPDHELKAEIERCKSILRDRLGEEVTMFAYPNGQRPDFDERTRRLLHSAGFRVACSTLWGTRNTPATLFALRRIMIDRDDDMLSFRLKIEGAYNYLGILHAMKPRRSV